MGFAREGKLYLVPSSSGAKEYKVDPDAPSCTCAHYLFRLRSSGGECKHIKAVKEEIAVSRPEVEDGVRQRVMDDIRSGMDDAMELIEKYGEDVLGQMESDGDIFEAKGRMKVLD